MRFVLILCKLNPRNSGVFCMSLLITNAKVINEGQIQALDVYIDNGRIESIGADLSSTPADRVIDAQGLYLMPGMIDDQVHFREPGLTHKGNIASESRAAIAGGITSYMEMPNTNPITDSAEAVEEKYQRAATKSLANFAFYLGATNTNLEAIKSLDPNLASGVKVFMGASTGNMLVNDPKVLEGIFEHCPILIATHCEDTPMIEANAQKFRERYGDDIPIECHPEIRSREACLKSSSLAVSLAKTHGANLHVLHLTTADELKLFQAGDVRHKKITAEVCVHHLFFSSDDYARLGAQIKCNPAIKLPSDRAALQQAVLDDVIDIIATDHAPHTWEEKQGTYFKSPAGLPLVQHALLSLLEHHYNGSFSLEKIVQKTSHAVAQRYQVKDRGFIREGYWADLVLVDLHKPTTVSKDNILYHCGWSPFQGTTFHSSIVSTIVNGHVVFDQGALQDAPLGQRLQFDRK